MTQHFILLLLMIVSIGFNAYGDAKQHRSNEMSHTSYVILIISLILMREIDVSTFTIILGYSLLRASIFAPIYNRVHPSLSSSYLGRTSTYDRILDFIVKTVTWPITTFISKYERKKAVWTFAIQVSHIICFFFALIVILSPRIDDYLQTLQNQIF